MRDTYSLSRAADYSINPTDICRKQVGFRMNEFIEFFESKGIKNIKNLYAFVHDFLQEPQIFFDLTETQRNEMEQKLDEALALFKN
jgi:hypothetical protein